MAFTKGSFLFLPFLLVINASAAASSDLDLDLDLLVTSGSTIYGDLLTGTSEVIPFNGEEPCPVSVNMDLPVSTVAASGGVLHSQILVSCGGFVNSSVVGQMEVIDKCYSPGGESPLVTMKQKRAHASSLVIDNGETLWVTGGIDENKQTQKTSEYISIKPEPKTTKGPNLPIPMRKHCSVMFGSNVAIFTSFQDTWIYQFDKVEWSKGPMLTVKRISHACGLIYEIDTKIPVLVVVGGFNTEKSVEIWHLTTTSHWKSIHPGGLDGVVRFAADATHPDWTKMFLLGGHEWGQQNYEKVNHIHTFFCAAQACSFVRQEETLRIGRIAGAQAYWIPSKIKAQKCRQKGYDKVMAVSGEIHRGAHQYFIEEFALDPELKKCPDKKKAADFQVGSSGGLLKDGFIVTCGGFHEDSGECNPEKGCETFPKLNGRKLAMRDARVYSAAAVVEDGRTLWMTGGFSGKKFLDSTEFIRLNQVSFTEGPQLPDKLSRHCIVYIDDSNTLIIGGSNSKGETVADVWSIDFFNRSNLWSRKPSLKVGRRGHTCGHFQDAKTMKQLAIVSGGTPNSCEIEDLDCNHTDTVEVLHVTSGSSEWQTIASLPVQLAFSAGLSVDADKEFLVLGGFLDMRKLKASNAVYSLSCSELKCEWIVLPVKLKPARGELMAFLVPDSISSCPQHEDDTDQDISKDEKESPTYTDMYATWKKEPGIFEYRKVVKQRFVSKELVLFGEKKKNCTCEKDTKSPQEIPLGFLPTKIQCFARCNNLFEKACCYTDWDQEDGECLAYKRNEKCRN